MAQAASVTGNPFNDGWTAGGNSLSNGVYVRGSANYSFNLYGSVMTIAAGDNMEISDGIYSWLAGDTVIGVGGEFVSITAGEAGWSAFTGNQPNAILAESTKLVAKFGTSGAIFSPSTVAPSAGNGIGGTADAGSGGVFMRSSGWFYEANWEAGAGTLQRLDKADHISRNGSTRPDASVGRLIWTWDDTSKHVDSWQMLLNTSLLVRLQPDFTGPVPGEGNMCIVSIQNRDSAYTDALITLPSMPEVPEPGSMLACLAGFSGFISIYFRRRR